MPRHLPIAAAAVTRFVGALSLLVVFASATAFAAAASQEPLSGPDGECTCRDVDEPADSTGLVWRGCGAALRAADIAALLAPVLWFSADEPFIVQGDTGLPHPHPCDDPAPGGVVYYQVRRIGLRGPERVTFPEHADPQFVEKVERFTLRYFFYYRYDFGVRGHEHDLEVADMQVVLETSDDGCVQVRLTRVIGFAHGVDWYSNELVVADDTALPITLLVEEGKHASAPDRNADGVYTPGYDVNRRVYDAWGVRDVLGSGFLIASEFRSSMFKTRRPGFRALPPDVERPDVQRRSIPSEGGELGTYVLRAATTVGACPPGPPALEALHRMMRAHRFGDQHAADQYQFDLLQELTEPLSGPRGLVPDVSARWDRGIGLSLMLRGLDLREAYIVPRVNWVGRDVSVEALFTRTAAQFSSLYISSGVAREYQPRSEGATAVADWRFVAEAGIKFRTVLTGRRRAFALGYDFAGLRLGVRSSGFDELRPIRLIVELGAGVW